jgi:acyl-CoA oxidase
MKLSNFIKKTQESDLAVIQKHPALLAILPLIYGAWADQRLTDSELEILIPATKKSQWLTDEEKKVALSWLIPNQPPKSETLENWADVIRRIAAHIPKSSKHSLAQLGAEIVRIASHEVVQRVTSDAATADLNLMEEVIGPMSKLQYLKLFSENELPIDWSKIGRQTAFSPQKMNDYLDGDYADIRKKVANIISQPPFTHIDEMNKTEYREVVLEWCQILADEGIGALAYPKEHGGGGDMGAYLAAFETIAYFDLSLVIKFGVQFGLFGGSIAQLGSERHFKKYLDDAGKLKLPGCFAMTELGHGSNVRDIETMATFDQNSQEFIIHTPYPSARKDYIGNAAAHGKAATVFSQLKIGDKEYGVHAFIVPIRDENNEPLDGVYIEDCGLKIGLNGVDNGRLWFNRVRVPRENLLNRFAEVDENGQYSSPIEKPSKRFFAMLGTLIGGRVGVPSAALSASKTALTIAIKYGEKRRQFGADDREETRLLDYKTHQRRLMPLLSKAYALDFALKDLLAQYVRDLNLEDKRELEALAAGLKSFSTWNATHTIQECREACGGQGYLAANRFADLKADTDVFTTFEGDNTVLMQLVAKGLLTQFKNEFNSENTFGYLKFFAEQITTTIDSINPFTGRSTSQDVLRDSEFQLSAFQYRERQLQIYSATFLRKLIKSGVPPYDAFIRSQNYLMDLAHASVERIILEKFIHGVNACEDETLRRPLKKLCDLFALWYIEQHAAWYLESGYMEGVQTKAISRQIEKLCFEVRQIAVDLVDAFQIPANCLDAPLLDL